jgi:PmbA protein
LGKTETPWAKPGVVLSGSMLEPGGAVGMWIENGEFGYPVSGITIAANLLHMMTDIEYIGNDREFRGAIVSPTILIREMTISGQ